MQVVVKMGDKRMNKKKDYVAICPKCKSIDVSLDVSEPLQFAYGTPSRKLCNNCGYSGIFPEIATSDIKKLKIKNVPKEKLTTGPLKDISYGRFIINIWWKIFAPLLLIFGIILIFLKPYKENVVGIIFGSFFIIISVITLYISYFRKK